MDTSEGVLEMDGRFRVARLPSDVVVHGRAGEGMTELIGDLKRCLSGAFEDRRGGLRKTCEVTQASSASDLRPASSASSNNAARSRPETSYRSASAAASAGSRATRAVSTRLIRVLRQPTFSTTSAWVSPAFLLRFRSALPRSCRRWLPTGLRASRMAFRTLCGSRNPPVLVGKIGDVSGSPPRRRGSRPRPSSDLYTD